MAQRIHVRAARASDLPRLLELQRSFVEGHCGEAWTGDALREYLEWMSPLDPSRIEDGTLLVAGLGSRIVGFASWSYRARLEGLRRLPGRKARRLDPQTEAARLEVFFVEPEWLKGAGERLLRVTEYAAKTHGFARAALRICPDGASQFQSAGYTPLGNGTLELPSGEVLPVVHMERSLSDARLPVRTAA